VFHRCYGDTYPAAHFYDAAELSSRVTDGRLWSVIAVSYDDVVGHSSIRVCHEDALVCETGHAVVDPQVRGQGLLQKLGFVLSRMVVDEGYTGYMHYPTTVHGIMQRASVAYGGHETGVMLSCLPVDTDYREFQQDAGRIAVTVAWQPLAAAPARTVFLPQRYESLLQQLYARLNLQRTLAACNDERLTADPVRVETEYSPERSTVLISLQSGTENL